LSKVNNINQKDFPANTTFISNGTINVDLWNNALEGLITIVFYANDTSGNIGSASVLITKKIPSKAIILG